MRFVCGPIPASQVGAPREEGWQPLGGADRDAGRFAGLAALLSIPFIAMAVWLLLSARSEIRALLRAEPQLLMVVLGLMVLLIPLHEFIHALAYFKGLRSPRLIMGAWIEKGMFYVVYDAPMARHRVLWMSVMPCLLLSVLPGIAVLCLPLRHEWMILSGFLILIHTALCTGDFLVWWQLGFKVPRGAWILNDGWTTYWTTKRSPLCPSI